MLYMYPWVTCRMLLIVLLLCLLSDQGTSCKKGVEIKPTPKVNVLLDRGSKHFKEKHRQAPPGEKGTKQGQKGTQILSIQKVELLGHKPDYATPPRPEEREVRITALVQEWIWMDGPDQKRWVRQGNPTPRANIKLEKGTWQPISGDYVDFTWKTNG